jgi:hypothetical protein
MRAVNPPFHNNEEMRYEKKNEKENHKYDKFRMMMMTIVMMM